MPFDGTLNEAAIAFARYRDHPSLRALSFVLRHRSLWPKGFQWNYKNCATCALGLAAAIWRDGVQPDDVAGENYNAANHRWAAFMFDIDADVADDIFFGDDESYLVEIDKIKPRHVADAIDRYLAAA